jgi:type IV fimbrial biogenesis protein FimT
MYFYNKKESSINGNTLLEVIFIIAIITILTTIAIPSLNKIFQKQEEQEITSSFISAFKMARSYALNYNQTVTVCPLENNRCINKWSYLPWSVFIDKNHNRKKDKSEKLISVFSVKNSSIKIKFKNRKYRSMTFTARGATQVATFHLCYKDKDLNKHHSLIIINRMGRVRVAISKNILYC